MRNADSGNIIAPGQISIGDDGIDDGFIDGLNHRGEYRVESLMGKIFYFV